MCNMPTVTCQRCGKEFQRNAYPLSKSKNHFCSRSCSVATNNSKFPKRVRATETKPCRYCSKLLIDTTRTYCNWDCYTSFVTMKSSQRLQEGKLISKSTIRRRLLECRPEQCEACGQGPEWNGKKLVLQIDHINGNNQDNNISNLRILCPNCHTQTPTYGFKKRV